MGPSDRIGIGSRTLYLLCLLCTSCVALLKSDKQSYVVGGWNSISQDELTMKLSPLMQTYLSEEVGHLYDPPIEFTFVPFFYDETNSDTVMIQTGRLDFAYHNGGGLSCLQAQYGYTIIATQITNTMGYETSCYGSLLFTAKSNTAIKNMNDFKGKKLGVGYPWAPGSFLLASKLLDQSGLNIYTSFSQVTFYLSNYAQMLDDILAGKIDVAMIQSAWIEANYPDKISQLVYHNVINASFAGESYPFPTSTKLVPTFGLAAGPEIPAQLTQQVASALRRLNSSHPAAKAAGIARFSLPASYEEVRDNVEHLGMMVTTPDGGKECRDIFAGLEHIISCPPGYQLKDQTAIINSCAAAGLACPSGMACYCGPCIPIALNVFPWQLLIGLCAGLYVVGMCMWIRNSAEGNDAYRESRMTLASFRKLLATKDLDV